MRAFEMALWPPTENNTTGWNSTQDIPPPRTCWDITARAAAWDLPAFLVTVLYYHHIWPEVHSDHRPMQLHSVFIFPLAHTVQGCRCLIKRLWIAFVWRASCPGRFHSPMWRESSGYNCMYVCVSAYLCVCVCTCLWAWQNIPRIVHSFS